MDPAEELVDVAALDRRRMPWSHAEDNSEEQRVGEIDPETFWCSALVQRSFNPVPGGGVGGAVRRADLSPGPALEVGCAAVMAGPWH